MVNQAVMLKSRKNRPLLFVTGQNSISALACSVAAELGIYSKRSDG